MPEHLINVNGIKKDPKDIPSFGVDTTAQHIGS